MKQTMILIVAIAASVAFADIEWPADIGKEVAQRQESVVPSGNSASCGLTGIFETICRIVRCSTVERFNTYKPGLSIVIR